MYINTVIVFRGATEIIYKMFFILKIENYMQKVLFARFCGVKWLN